MPKRSLYQGFLALVLGVLAASLFIGARGHALTGDRDGGENPQESSYGDQKSSPTPLKQAEDYLSEMSRSASSYVRDVASRLDPDRSLRIQEALLREDLIWMDRGLTERQIDLMVFVSVALSVEVTEQRIHETRNAAPNDPMAQGRLESLELYRGQALMLLESLSQRLHGLSERELKFRF